MGHSLGSPLSHSAVSASPWFPVITEVFILEQVSELEAHRAFLTQASGERDRPECQPGTTTVLQSDLARGYKWGRHRLYCGLCLPWGVCLVVHEFFEFVVLPSFVVIALSVECKPATEPEREPGSYERERCTANQER